MTCTEIERRIFLYRELTEGERLETDEHLRSCASCRQVMERATASSQIIREQLARTASLRNHSAMTRRILDAVGERKRGTSPWISFRQGLTLPSLRYAMASLSLVLVVAFFVESTGNGESLVFTKRYPVMPGQPVLNVAAFHSALFDARNSRRQSTLVAKCVASCLGSKDECDDCASMFLQKPEQ